MRRKVHSLNTPAGTLAFAVWLLPAAASLDLIDKSSFALLTYYPPKPQSFRPRISIRGRCFVTAESLGSLLQLSL